MSNLSKDIVDLAIFHPSVISVALDIVFHPEHRERYSPMVLALADLSIFHIKQRLEDFT